MIQRIDSVYDDYLLYSLIFGRDQEVKTFEAHNSVIAAERLLKRRGITSPIKILELFAGLSEHARYFKILSRFGIGSYDCLDNAEHLKDGTPSGVVWGDAVDGDFPGYDFMIAHFFSLNGPMVRDELQVSRSTVVTHLKNVVRNLRGNKYATGYFVNLGPPVLNVIESVATLRDEMKFGYLHVHPFHPIRARFDYDPFAPLWLEVSGDLNFNRLTRTLTTTFSQIRLASDEGQVLNEWSVRYPFCFRTWSEDEMTDMMLEAGFDDLVFFHNNRGSYNDNPEHKQLGNIITIEDVEDLEAKDEKELVTTAATDLLAILDPK